MFPGLLNRLTAQLRDLHEIARQGEWERIEALEKILLPDLASLAAAPRQIVADRAFRSQLLEIQNLLDTAKSQCSTRMGQIKPLVDALRNTQATPDSP